VSQSPRDQKSGEALSDDLIEFALGTFRSKRSLFSTTWKRARTATPNPNRWPTSPTRFVARSDAERLGFETRVIESSEAVRRSVRIVRRDGERVAVRAMLVAVLGLGSWCGGDEPRCAICLRQTVRPSTVA